MYKVIFGIMFAFVVAAKPLAEQNESKKVYQVMVEAGAKLLEFDIIRENLNMREKEIVAELGNQRIVSAEGRTLTALVPLEKMVRGYVEIIPIFIALQTAIESDFQSSALQKRLALNGLIGLLEAPEALHTLLPPPHVVGEGYKQAMSYLPVITFIKSIQKIAHRQFFLHYCDIGNNPNVFSGRELEPEVKLFYDIIKQTVSNMFDKELRETILDDITMQYNLKDSSQTKHPSRDSFILYIDLNIMFNARLGRAVGSLEWSDLQDQKNKLSKEYGAQVENLQNELDMIDNVYKSDLVKIKRNHGRYNPADYMSSPHKAEQREVDKRTARYEREYNQVVTRKHKLEETRDAQIAELEQAQVKINEKIFPIAKVIAKRLGAQAVEVTDNAFYVNPELDITQEVIEQLNANYLNQKF